MSSLLKYAVGLDMASEEFQANFSQLDQQLNIKIKGSRKFKNTPSGFKELITWVQKRVKEDIPLVFVCEATGPYYESLVWFLHEQDYRVCVVLANRAKKYMRSLGLNSKNDSIDARGLAAMGLQQALRPFQPISKMIYRLRQLTRQLESLQKMATMTKNRLHAHQSGVMQIAEVINSDRAMIKALDKQIEQIKKQITQTVMGDQQLARKWKLIEPIKGVGIITFASVVAETNGFALFTSINQLVSYAGYDVVENQSGNRQGKTRMSKNGNTHIRRTMNMPAWQVVKYEPRFKTFFERILGRTNIKMKAYVAVQRKLLALIFTLWKNDQPFQAEFK